MKSTQTQDRTNPPNNTSDRLTGSLSESAYGEVATERDSLLSSHSVTLRGRNRISTQYKYRLGQQPTKYQSIDGQSAMQGNTSQLSRGSPGPQSYPQLSSAGRDTFTLDSAGSSYEIYNDKNPSDIRKARSHRSNRSQQSRKSRTFSEGAGVDRLHQYYDERANRIFSDNTPVEPPLLEVSPAVISVRKGALTVYDPLTHTWLVFSAGFVLGSALGMAKWAGVLGSIPYFLVLLPFWLSHLGLMVCQIMAGRALAIFIAEANNNRTIQDSSDHFDRNEYLPLLQRALKFGLRTGLISLCVFTFEILLYIKLSRGTMSLAIVFIPLWIIVLLGIINGIICKTQHLSRLVSWMLALSLMILLVLRVDYGIDQTWLRRSISVAPLALLGMALMELTYILQGHRVGYFRLTESQRTAGILYTFGVISYMLLVTIICLNHVERPEGFKIRVALVALACLSFSFVGLGAWAVSRDEFDRLLQFGGQATVHPMGLRLEPSGWTAVQSKGVIVIPMFGEVRYEPISSDKKKNWLEFCCLWAFYPFEVEDVMHAPSHEYPFLCASSGSRSRSLGRKSSGSPRRPV